MMTLSIKLFNAVLAKEPSGDIDPTLLKMGVVVAPEGRYANEVILKSIKEYQLSGEQLNTTFHKSWEVIKESSRESLAIEQLLHYISTYGSDFEGELYVPEEVLNIPALSNKLPLKVIQALTPYQMMGKCLSLLSSGVALKEETITDVLALLNELGHKFENVDGIRNKEALVRVVAQSGVYPSQPVEFLRYLVYLSTGSTLLIKSAEVIGEIKMKNLIITNHLQAFGLEKCAEVFNRFKPLWLAFKKNKINAPLINRIAKLSKRLHKPMESNPLSLVTSMRLSYADSKIIDKATIYALIRAYNVCREYQGISIGDPVAYRIRNGKGYAKKALKSASGEILSHNLKVLGRAIQKRVGDNFKGKEFYIPNNTRIPAPTSEKAFVGNFPQGTSITHKKLVMGVYWEDAWGANDLDLSAMSVRGKIGWNSQYSSDEGTLLYSGDMTSAPHGAAEYLYTKGKGLEQPSLVNLNVYSGSEQSKYHLILGKGSDIRKNCLLDPNKLILTTPMKTLQKESVVGLLTPAKGNKVTFTFLELGTGSGTVSRGGHSDLFRVALVRKWENPLTMRETITMCGGVLVDEVGEETRDLKLQGLDKNSLMSLFV